MPLTRAFDFGDGQAVLIPEEMANEDIHIELTISRTGDVIVIQPARPSMREIVAVLRASPKPDEVEAYEPIELPEREGL